MVFILVGQDSLAKDLKISRIKQESLPKNIEDFNSDILYARDLDLKSLQERILFLPVRGDKRIIVIKGAQDLKEDIKDFISRHFKKPSPGLILILDIDRIDSQGNFINNMAKLGKVFYFKGPDIVDSFSLGRQIERRDTPGALNTLHELLQNGQRPEMILGGLRYACQRQVMSSRELNRRVKLLLNCDIDIKTGRLKADFALERLIVRLCGLTKP